MRISRRGFLKLAVAVAAGAAASYLAVRLFLAPSRLGLRLPVSLPGSIFANGGVVLNEEEIAFQIVPGERGDYALLLRGGELTVIPDNADVRPNTDYSNITGSQMVNGLYFFGGGEEAAAPWSPCAFPCAPYLAVYDGTLRIIKIPSGSCDNMNFTGVAYDGEYYYAFGGANVGTETGWTGVVILDGGLNIAAMNSLAPYDDAGNQINMYRSGPKQYSGGRIYTLAYNGPNLYLESVKTPIRNAGTICFQANIAPSFEAYVAGDFNPSAIPVLAPDLSVAYFNGKSVIWRGREGDVIDSVPIPNPAGNVFIKVKGGELFVANQDGGVFKVLAPTAREFKGLGFIDWRGYAVVFESLRAGARVSIIPII
ncbi:MAG: twin-arginine translocation signal domain-containing protein [Thermoproteus sp. AZ2]|uniref:Twin-arginine translocation signal domain-containing protein n=1 Tax=Thermoproteus sp. AZ2 TaxID=1609232 RepID=A0ACC6UXX7_9CREN